MPILIEQALARIAPGVPARVADLGTGTVAVRPSELVELLGPDVSLLRGRRLNQWITVDGARDELPPVPGPATWHTERRAS